MLIGEVARQSGISARMLRHYDAVGLVSPTGRTSGGYREYSDDDVRRLFQVEGLRTLGLSLQAVAGVLGDLSFSPSAMVEQLVVRTRERLAREEELLDRLRRVRASDPAAWSDVLSTIGLLRALDAGDPSTRQRAVLARTDEGDRDVVPLAEAALKEPDPHVAGALDWALARAGDGAVPVLADALDSPDAERRHRALTALTKIGTPGALGVLAEAFDHPDPVLAGRAALVRGTRGDIGAVPALVALVVEGRDDVEAADVLAGLATRGHADAITGAIADELHGAGPDVRRRLVSALADVPGPPAQAVLAGLIDDPDRGVAFTAAYLVRERGSGD